MQELKEHRDMENNIFNVGLTLSLETRYKTHLWTHVIGWEKDEYILTRAIHVQGQPAKLNSKDPCKVRWLMDGVALGFESEIITVQFFPYPLMFIKYPVSIERLQLRVAQRFKVDLPVKLSDAAQSLTTEGVMLDLSEGGCGLKVPVQNGKELSPDAAYTIAFKLMDKEISIGCTVKKLDQTGKDAYLLGMQFTSISPQQKEALNFFLELLKKNATP
jgi:c-di-GMP-binding flagellar brake protein YcgR